MDIAEIRKKAKSGKREGGMVAKESKAMPALDSTAVDGLPLETEPASVPAREISTLPAPIVTDVRSPLDRLFASGSDARFASEEIYQSTLATHSFQDESALNQFLAFQLGSEEYALDINQISEIIKPREYTDIPRVPDFILGLVSLRGVVVPIFDLRQRFQLGRVTLSSAARVIVCREEGVTAGLLVDKINQVVKIAADTIEPPPAVIAGGDRNLISGIGRYQGRLIIILNLASVLEIVPG